MGYGTQMNAEIVSIGTELLLGQIVNTNAAYLAAELAALGVPVYHQTTVGDNLERAVEVLRQALSRADVVLITGGLGPTPDDITREVVARALGEELVFDEESAEQIRAFFAARGREATETNLRQAYLPASAQPIPNPLGTAPGVLAEKGGKIVVALPGVPPEMKQMWAETVKPYLRQTGRIETFLRSRTLRVVGLGESFVADRLGELLDSTNPTLATYAQRGEVTLRLTARAVSEEEAQTLLDELEQRIRERIGPYICGRDEEGLEYEVGRLLRATGWTIAVAESCTGGLIGHRLTAVPGSSDYFVGGIVAYSNEVKRRWLGVPEETLRRVGAVSEETARAMAQGVRERLQTDLGLACTGIAGPGGGTPEKPVGLVYVALAAPDEGRGERHRWRGSREDIKYRASQAALDLLRRYLAGRIEWRP